MDGKPENGTAPDCAEIATKEQVIREVLCFIYDHPQASRTKILIGGVSESGYVLDNDRLVITYAVPSLLYALIDFVKEINDRKNSPYITVGVWDGGIVID